MNKQKEAERAAFQRGWELGKEAGRRELLDKIRELLQLDRLIEQHENDYHD